MTPKIIFKYSWIYDQNWKMWIKNYKFAKEYGQYPSTKEILDYIPKINKLWEKDEEKVLKELSKITGIKWEEKIIKCYVVGQCIPFSDPLTLSLYRRSDYFIDVLTHELIHRLFCQSIKGTKKAWEHIHKNYKNYPHKVRIHIILHAIHTHVFLKFFGEQRLEREIRIMSKLSDYKQAWDIVKKEGYQNIINGFKEKIK